MLTNSSGLYHDLQQKMNSSIDVSKTSQSQGAVNLLTLCGLHMYTHVYFFVREREREHKRDKWYFVCLFLLFSWKMKYPYIYHEKQ